MDEADIAKAPSALEADIEPEAAAAAPVADEHETVAIPTADETKATLGAEETAAAAAEETRAAVGEAGEAVETGGVDGAVAAALQEQAGAEEPEAEPQAAEEEAPAIVPAGWETAQPWLAGNVLLIAATVVLVVAEPCCSAKHSIFITASPGASPR